MFKVMAKNRNVIRTVYAVKEDPVKNITLFLIFELDWIWMNSNLYEPIQKKG